MFEMAKFERIGIIGAGAWGTALAQVAAYGDRPVRIWARDPAVAEAINTTHANPLYLPNIALSPSIEAVSDPAAMAEMDALLVVTPAQAVGAVLATMPVGHTPLVLCSKGIEAGTRRLVGEVARSLFPEAPIAVLSGPTFAHEVAAGLPTVAFDTSMNREIVGETGVLVPQVTPQAFASGIASLLNTAERRDALGIRARQLAVERCSWQAVAPRLVTIYKQAAAELRRNT